MNLVITILNRFALNELAAMAQTISSSFLISNFLIKYSRAEIVEIVNSVDIILFKVITKHGGEVEENYSSRCTHFLCLHQQGEDFKKVNIFLLIVGNTKSVIWFAKTLH